MHSENCKANHFANSGSMEVSGTIEIFQRSESLHGQRYTKFLGDGDSRAYKAINEMQPYEDTGIEKLECVGYVGKRMETRLRTFKLKMNGLRVPSQKQSVFTSRREQLESVSSTRERSVDICSRLLPLDETLYLAPSASVAILTDKFDNDMQKVTPARAPLVLLSPLLKVLVLLSLVQKFPQFQFSLAAPAREDCVVILRTIGSYIRLS
ncbi:uncharacterized protein LOC100901629 [Trichonephila clavipes]|nr:uncharacterized protein LOC100901629 [Trichonephila clavipes]